MKNIYEDETLPSGIGKPPILKNDSKGPAPSRPKRQVTPPPMKQMPTQPVYMPPQPAMPVQPVAPQQGVYPYNPQYPPQGQPYPQQGVAYYPVYDPNTQQPVYPQGVPYMPYGYMPQGTPVPAAPQTAEEETKEEYDPGTRVLYQSPDFDNKDGSGFSDNVGANFANMIKQTNEKADKEKEEEVPAEAPVNSSVDFEEVSIDFPRSTPKKPPVRKAAPPIINTSALTDEDVYSDSKTGDISFSAYNAVKPSMDVEDFEQELPPYEEYDDDEDIAEYKAAMSDESEDTDKKALPKSEIIRRSVLVVAIIAIVISAGMLLNEWRLSRQNDNVMEEVEELIKTEPTTNKKDKDKTTTEALTPEEQWAQIKEEYPNVLFPANIQLKYAKLYGENQDFVGYISADGINLNLPVVQTNNNDTYLKKNFYGSTTKYGCPFVDYLNNMSYNHLDMNTVIYGHHMNNGTIFGALDKYKTITGYKKAPVISFNTLYKDYQWKIIAVFITNGHSKDDNNYLFPYTFTNLSSASKMSAYLSEIAQRSLYDTGVDVLPSDKLLTLSTCSHEFEDARLVVVARLVRPGESATVDTSKVVANSKPRYPQAYYTKKGMTNPYKNSSKWIVS